MEESPKSAEDFFLSLSFSYWFINLATNSLHSGVESGLFVISKRVFFKKKYNPNRTIVLELYNNYI